MILKHSWWLYRYENCAICYVSLLNQDIIKIINLINEREGFMQETQHHHPNSTKPRQENMNVNGYKNTDDKQKQTNIY